MEIAGYDFATTLGLVINGCRRMTGISIPESRLQGWSIVNYDQKARIMEKKLEPPEQLLNWDQSDLLLVQVYNSPDDTYRKQYVRDTMDENLQNKMRFPTDRPHVINANSGLTQKAILEKQKYFEHIGGRQKGIFFDEGQQGKADMKSLERPIGNEDIQYCADRRKRLDSNEERSGLMLSVHAMSMKVFLFRIKRHKDFGHIGPVIQMKQLIIPDFLKFAQMNEGDNNDIVLQIGQEPDLIVAKPNRHMNNYEQDIQYINKIQEMQKILDNFQHEYLNAGQMDSRQFSAFQDFWFHQKKVMLTTGLVARQNVQKADSSTIVNEEDCIKRAVLYRLGTVEPDKLYSNKALKGGSIKIEIKQVEDQMQ